MLTNYAIALLSYDHPDLTAKAVASVLSLNFSKEKLFLIHNGSELSHVNRLKTQFPDIRHLQTFENKGYSAGANFGFKEIFNIEENIFFLTNDTEVLELPKFFPQDLDLFSIPILKRNTQQLDSIQGVVNLRTGRLQHLRSFDSNLKPYMKTYVPGSAFGLTKKAFEILDGFDESFHTYWEDVDLSLRAALQPTLRMGFSESFKVRHKIGKTCHKSRFYTLYLFQRNRRRVLACFGTFPVLFYFNYGFDMGRLFFKILFKSDRKKQLQFWWKALYD